MKTVRIGADSVPAIGQGTYQMGSDPVSRGTEVAALRYGIEQGLTLIDTAEMYADGGAEQVVGEAVSGIRDRVFLVTKVWPPHMSANGIRRALEASLRRLRVDQVDLYLLHWPSQEHPIQESLEGLAAIHQAGLARYVGISNFPTPHLKEAMTLFPSGTAIAADQVEYHLLNRRAETALIPYARERHVAIMAYSPVKDLRQLSSADPRIQVLQGIAEHHGATIESVALAYLIGAGPVVAIPKAVGRAHIDANRAALDLTLTEEDRRAIAAAFPRNDEELPFHAL